MSGWLWVVVGVVAWLGVAVVVSFGIGAVLRAVDRRDRRNRPGPADRLERPRDDTGWPAAG